MKKLIALREFRHGRQFLAPSDEFSATELDAAYYVRHGMAKEKESLVRRLTTRTRAIEEPPVVKAEDEDDAN